MGLECPQCSHLLKLGRLKPGAYGLKCPQCSAPLKLRVPTDPALPPRLNVREEAGAPRADEAVTITESASLTQEYPPENSDQGRPPEEAPAEDDGRKHTGADGASWRGGRDAEVTVATPVEGPGSGSDLGETMAATPGVPPARGGASAVAGQTPTPRVEPAEDEYDVPEVLGGYRLLGQLGKGGMGAVYKARQISLDRDVALKVMAPRLASNPTFVSRFCREAYAAAQLSHHNVVQIYDFGEDRGRYYFSMEFVDGQSLSVLLEEHGPLDPREAAGYALQAARGLKQAHDRGLIHRDIKPDNLMLNKHGVVKVADLGLVKSVAALEPNLPEAAGEGSDADAIPPARARAGHADRDSLATQVTRVDIAMGTPAFMAPEQARDAANVDHRADIYALGCTLYALVTGRSPFQGKSALELITKHAMEPIVPPELIVKGTPDSLSAVIVKMVAKQPDARYASLDEVIGALEEFLKISSAAPLREQTEEAAQLKASLSAMTGKAPDRIRAAALMVLVAACGAGIVLALLWGQPRLAGAALGLGLLTPPAYLVFGEIKRRSELWRRARQWALESGPSERLAVAAVVVVMLAVLWMAGIVWLTLGLIVCSVALATPARWVIELAQAGQEPVERIQEVLKGLRIRGFDEEAIRRCVAERAGPRWESVRDAVFGPEDRLAAYRSRGRAEWERARTGLAAWRGAAVLWFESRVAERQDSRVQRHLEHVEQESLRAQGMGLDAASRKARKAAAAMMAQAAQLRTAGVRATRTLGATIASEEGRAKVIRSLHEAAERPEQFLQSMEGGLLARHSEESLDALLGPRTRFVSGVVLVACFLLWAAQNGWRGPDEAALPLWLPLVPSILTGMFRDWNALFAGTTLMISALWRGWRISLPVIPAAVIALAGSTFGLPAWLSLLAGAVVAGLGFTLARSKIEQ